MEIVTIDDIEYKFFEQKTLMDNIIYAPLQTTAKNPKICTSFAYTSIQHKDMLIDLYTTNDHVAYRDLINKIISEADKRNTNLESNGEFINAQTIKRDFPDIYNCTI